MSKVTMADPNASCTFRLNRDLVFISPDFYYAQYFRVPIVDQAPDAVSEPDEDAFLAMLKYVIHSYWRWIKKFSCWYAPGHHLKIRAALSNSDSAKGPSRNAASRSGPPCQRFFRSFTNVRVELRRNLGGANDWVIPHLREGWPQRLRPWCTFQRAGSRWPFRRASRRRKTARCGR